MIKSDFADYVVDDLMSGIDGISSRKMFGGMGLYRYGIIFGIIFEDELYFKVDDSNRKEFEKRDSHAFTYLRNGKEVSLSYWLLPSEVIDDEKELEKWIDMSAKISKKQPKSK